ncbi:SpaA isopeptide-forming pilin-related protein [Microbacterium sp. LjRoot45]|uniref:DUF7927 domain-containing protein n=1 Tax=Microbacterium sp. LjRoot45 TaxID=3342329 RepID=UPI003ECE206E
MTTSVPLSRRTPLRRGRGILLVGLVAVGLVAGVVGVPAEPAAASVNPPNTTIRATNTFYAYANASENIDVTFVKVALSVTSNQPIRILAPDGTVTTCTLSAGAVGSTCARTNLTSTVAGIWTVTYTQPAIAGSADQSRWTINVQAGNTTIPGRVWSDSYAMYNDTSTNVNLWYRSSTGFLYFARHYAYRGIDSVFRANQFGIVATGTCTPAYRSKEQNDTARVVSGTECGTPYHLFFELPATDLPETAVDGQGTTHFVSPVIRTVELTDLVLTTDGPLTREGQFTFDSANHIGSVEILVDADADGSYGGPLDRRLPVAISADGTHTVAFDGLDGAGNPIPHDRRFTAKVALARVGEIHFVSSDVEARGGLRVDTLNGPAANTSTLYWNDSALSTAGRNASCLPPVMNGSAGYNSNPAGGSGVHGWPCVSIAGNTWGNNRSIEDWTYQPVDISSTAVIAAVANYRVQKTSTPASGTAVKPGDTIAYTLTVQQTGNAPANASLTDDLSDVLDDATVGTVAASSGTATLSGSTLAWSGTLPVGGTATVTYTATVKDRAGLAADGDYRLDNVVTSEGCRAAPQCTTTHPVGTYTVEKTADPPHATDVYVGDSVTYTVTVTQVGTGAVTGASFDDELIGVLDAATWDGTVTASAGTASFDVSTSTLSWAGDLAVGQTATVTYSVTVTDDGDAELMNIVMSDGCIQKVRCETTHNVKTRVFDIGVQKVGLDDSGEFVLMDGSRWAIFSARVGGTAVIADLPASGSGSVGEFAASLAPGTYWLEETRALDGFSLLAERVAFTLATDGTVTLGAGASSNVTLVGSADAPIIRVEDVPALDLPETGGTGTAPLYLVGGGLLLAALCVLLIASARRRSATHGIRRSS